MLAYLKPHLTECHHHVCQGRVVVPVFEDLAGCTQCDLGFVVVVEMELGFAEFQKSLTLGVDVVGATSRVDCSPHQSQHQIPAPCV